MGKQRQRKRILIDKKFQFWFVRYSMTLVLLTSLLYCGGFYLFLNEFKSKLNNSGLPPSNIIMTYLNQQTLSLSLFFAAVFVLIIILTFFIGIYHSHRIAGPIMKLKQFFAETSPSDLNSEIKFRKTDLFFDLAESANKWKNKSSSM